MGKQKISRVGGGVGWGFRKAIVRLSFLEKAALIAAHN